MRRQWQNKRSAKQRTCVIMGKRVSAALSAAEERLFFEAFALAVRRSVFQGYDTFLCGMSLGEDILAAEALLWLKKEFPHIQLVCCLPYEAQADHWPEHWRERYFQALALADDVQCLQVRYSADAAWKLAHALTAAASRVLACVEPSAGKRGAYLLQAAAASGCDILFVPREEGDMLPDMAAVL